MSNRRDTVNFEIDIADLPMLVHALMIQATTSQMCSRYVASDRMRMLIAKVKEQVPKISNIFDEQVFCEMCAALALDPKWTTCIERSSYRWGREGYIVAEIGGRKFKSEKEEFTDESVEFKALGEFLDEMSPTREEQAAWAPDDYAHPITAERAKEILHEHGIRFGMQITHFMTEEEQRDIRRAWLDQNNAKMTLRDYVIKVSKSGDPMPTCAP